LKMGRPQGEMKKMEIRLVKALHERHLEIKVSQRGDTINLATYGRP